jgi:hypothetical protein
MRRPLGGQPLILVIQPRKCRRPAPCQPPPLSKQFQGLAVGGENGAALVYVRGAFGGEGFFF